MKIDFIGRKTLWFSLSAILIALSIIGIVVRGLHFGIEFTGGTEISWRFEKKVNISEVRKVLSIGGLQNAVVQPSEKTDFFIRTQRLSTSAQEKATNALKSNLGGDQLSIQSVGAAWGQQITNSAVLALILSMAALLAYISIRFEFKMAVSAIIALVHDILITLGIYALSGKEITPSTIAALLTILGYSLYDTIVVFHRILENSNRLIKKPYSDVVNDSVNEVLVRSINTSVTTLLPVVALLTIGGETLKDFAFALFVGIASGTYSSIFTASPILAIWKEREPKYIALRKRLAKKAV